MRYPPLAEVVDGSDQGDGEGGQEAGAHPKSSCVMLTSMGMRMNSMKAGRKQTAMMSWARGRPARPWG